MTEKSLVEESVAVVRTLLADVGKCLGAIGESRSKGDAFNVFRLSSAASSHERLPIASKRFSKRRRR